MFSLKPDFEQTLERFEAFWERKVLDRPVVQLILNKPTAEQVSLPESTHASPAERWMDARYQAALALATLRNGLYPGDTLPVAWPNLGPDVFAALYGCPLEFGEYSTSWASPILHDWSQAADLRLDWDSPYLHKLDEMTDALLEVGRGTFITGMSDWHAGGDCLAALRGSQNLALDLVEHPVEVKALLGQVEADYFELYEHFYQKLRDAGQPITSWINAVGCDRFYIPSNDFSALISSKMFAEFFLPGIRRECQFLNHSIYHLDGPGAVRHLERLLQDVPELDAVQFVPTPGDEAFSRWAPLYQRIQAAGKGVHFTCEFKEVGEVMQALRPEGLFMQIKNAPSLEAAETILRELEQWTSRTLTANYTK